MYHLTPKTFPVYNGPSKNVFGNVFILFNMLLSKNESRVWL